MPKIARTPGPITHAELLEHVHYDPKTGVMTWRKPGPRRRVGEEIGWRNWKGYREVQLLGECWYINRLAVFYMTGKRPDPDVQVDHKNLIRDDNRWNNLRPTTQSQNQLNTERYGEQRGIQYRGNDRWRIRLNIEGKRVNRQIIGTYEDALRERDILAEQRGGLRGDIS